jgi:LmbE family N-acetylglucosaminyl deacetylase
MKLDILALAHPDDVELGCSGTILKEISLGKTGSSIWLWGELGTRGQQNRDQEANAAAKIWSSACENLEMRGFFVNDEKHQLEIIKCYAIARDCFMQCGWW